VKPDRSHEHGYGKEPAQGAAIAAKGAAARLEHRCPICVFGCSYTRHASNCGAAGASWKGVLHEDFTSARKPAMLRPLKRTRAKVGAFVALLLVASSSVAHAQSETPVGENAVPPDAARARPERTWSFQDEPQLAAPMQAVALSRLTYTSVGASPTRPFASNVASPGGTFELGGELGLVNRLSVEARALLGESGRASTQGVGATAGLRLALLPASWESTRAVVSAGYLRELSGGSGAWGRLTISQDVGRARIAGTLHGEHIFTGGRDAIDVMVMAGVSYRVAGPVRAGIEYVVQDLEGAFDPAEAEGGVRHFLGPTVSAELFDRRLSLVAGPALGLSYASPRLLGRIGLAYVF
jgi:hypothetical protein